MRSRFLGLGVAMLAATALAVFATSSSSPTQRDETSWLTAAQHALRDPSWQCTPNWPTAKKIDLPDLGVVDQICTRPSGEVSIIRYKEMSGDGITASGVIYDRSQALPIAQPDSCVKRINGPWWWFVPANPNCPNGYQVVGGG